MQFLKGPLTEKIHYPPFGALEVKVLLRLRWGRGDCEAAKNKYNKDATVPKTSKKPAIDQMRTKSIK